MSRAGTSDRMPRAVLERELEASRTRIQDLEHHLAAAIRHIANEKRPPIHFMATARNLLEKK